jgi:hypothetical protein
VLEQLSELDKIRAAIEADYRAEKRALLKRTFWMALPFAALAALLLICLPASADEDGAGFEAEALTTYMRSGAETPPGGVGVYDRDFSRRVGTIETLGDGSTVFRGDFGRVEARAERDGDRVTVRTRE